MNPRLFGSILCSLILISLLFSPMAQANILLVAPHNEVPPSTPLSTMTYVTIQAAVDAAMPGDTVVVADGTYTGTDNVDLDFGGKNIVVKSANGPSKCIIDCQGSSLNPHRGFFFVSGETSAATVDGFTVEYGWASSASEDGISDGGGLLAINSCPTVTNCKFISNTAEGGFGGGVRIDPQVGENATVTGCTFSGNSATDATSGPDSGLASEGGGLCILDVNGGSPSVTRCSFDHNSADYGGGADVFADTGGSTFIDHCQFANDTATSSSAFEGGEGGGLYFGGTGCNVTVSNCTFTDETADGEAGGFGGGMSLNTDGGSNPTVIACNFIGNMIVGDDASGGGGLFVASDGLNPSVTNCTFSDNVVSSDSDGYVGDGGGLAFDGNGPLSVTRCRFNSNEAGFSGGIGAGGSMAVTDCTFFGNGAQFGGGLGGYIVSATNCTFSENTVDSNGSGALYANYLSALNCTFSYNIGLGSDGTGSSAIEYAYTADVTNCIMYGDIGVSADGSDAGSEINSIDYSMVIASNNDIEYYTCNYNTGQYVAAVYPEYYAYDEVSQSYILYDPTTNTYGPQAHSGTGEINADPQFADDDLHLSNSSPCLGAGSAGSAPPTDLEGRPRPSPPSMGAYEVGPIPLTVTDAILGLPQFVYNAAGQLVLDENVYFKGNGNGLVFGHWSIPGTTFQSSSKVSLNADTWTQGGEVQIPWATVKKKQFSLVFQPDSPTAPVPDPVDAIVTGFRPDLNGWPFENFRATILGFPSDLFGDGNCNGMTATAQYYYNSHQSLPAPSRFIYDIIEGSQKAYGAWYTKFDTERFASGMEGADEALYNAETDTLIQELRQSPTTINLIGRKINGKGAGNHAVLAMASFSSPVLLDDSSADADFSNMQSVTNLRTFAVYDPNFPGMFRNFYLGDYAGSQKLQPFPVPNPPRAYQYFQGMVTNGYTYHP